MPVTLLTDNDERFKNLFGKVALFILLALVGMGIAFLWTGIKKGVFTVKSSIYFVADSGQDLAEGMPVKLSGFKIGKLKTLMLDDQGLVQVEINIETKYLKLIREDAVISLKKEELIGDGILDISQGTKNRPVLAEDAVVRFERPVDLKQTLIDMKDRIVPIIDDLHRLLHAPDSDVRLTLKNLRELSAEMRGTREHVDRILLTVDNKLNAEVGALLQSLHHSAMNAETLSIKLNHDLPALLEKADAGMENLHLTSKLIYSTVQDAVPQLQEILNEGHETLSQTRIIIEDTQDAVDSLSTRWPLKNAVPEPETGPIKMDSHD